MAPPLIIMWVLTVYILNIAQKLKGYTSISFFSKRLRSSEFVTTVIDENHMAIQAHSGLSVKPFTG